MPITGPINPIVTNLLTKNLNEYLASNELKKILVVTGSESFTLSGAKEKIFALKDNFHFLQWCDFSPNPSYSDLLKGIHVAQNFEPDAIIGIGGGSALDMAKMISVKMGADHSEGLNLEVYPRNAKLILIPTTAGSGSEATHFSVLYVNEKKYSVVSKQQYADLVVLDSELVLSNPPKQKAYSGIDALSQAIESLWANNATEESHKYAVKSLEIINRFLREFVKYPSITNASQMLIGSHIAGRAIDLSKTTGPHAISYGLTSILGVPHGNAVALTLGRFIDLHNSHFGQNKKLDLAMVQINTILGITKEKTGSELIKDLLKDLDLISNLSELGLSKNNIEQLINFINLERMNNNPIQLTKKELISILTN